MALSQLLLHPVIAHIAPTDMSAVIDDLQQIGFIAHPLSLAIDKTAVYYQVGEHFLQLVPFLGCSPFIHTEPTDDNSPFCYVQFPSVSNTVQFIHGLTSTFPRCPHCKHTLTDQHLLNSHWNDQYICPTCQTSSLLYQLNWRQAAGFSCCFITINNIYQHEAVPDIKLLKLLEKHTPCSWNYFYLHR